MVNGNGIQVSSLMIDQIRISMRDIIIDTLGYTIITKNELLNILVRNYSNDYEFTAIVLDRFLRKFVKDGIVEYSNFHNRYYFQLTNRGIDEFRLIRALLSSTVSN